MIPAGYALHPRSGFYFYSDGSGPYVISPAGVVYLVGQGPQGERGLPGDAGALPPTNLSYTPATGQGTVNSSTGSSAIIPAFGAASAGLVPASGGGTSNFLRADGAFAPPPTGGGSGVFTVKENGSVISAVAAVLDFLGADFNVSESPAGELNISIPDTIARVLGSVTLSANTSLTAALHSNRTILVDTAGLTLTINNDGTGGWDEDDFLDIQAIGAGSFTLVQGTATLTTDSGASAVSALAIGKRVQAQRVGTSAWRTVSPAIPTSTGGNVTAYASPAATTYTVPTGAGEQVVGSINLGSITGEAWIECKSLWTADTGSAGSATIRYYLNGVMFFQDSYDDGAGFESKLSHGWCRRLTDTSIQGPGPFQAIYLGNADDDPPVTVSPTSLAAGAVLEIRSLRGGTTNTRPMTVEWIAAQVNRVS